MLAVRSFPLAGVVGLLSGLLFLSGGRLLAIDLDHTAGLEALAEVHPVDPVQAEFGVLKGDAFTRFLQRSNAVRKLMGQYGGGPMEYEGEGWLERREEGDRFWLLGAYPIAVDLEEPKPGAATSVDGPIVATFEPRNLAEFTDQLAETLGEFDENQRRRLPSGQGPALLLHAALTHAEGERIPAAKLAVNMMADVSGPQVDLMLAGAVNQLSEARYLEALRSYMDTRDQEAFASEVEAILAEFEGSTYWEGALRLLLTNLRQAEPPEGSEWHPIATALTTTEDPEATMQLIGRLNRQFWLYEPELLLRNLGDQQSPLVELVLKGPEGLRELLPMLQDRRLTPIVEAHGGLPELLNSHFHDMANFYGEYGEGEAERRFSQLPHPLSVAEVAGRLLDPFLDYQKQQLPPEEKAVAIEPWLTGIEGKSMDVVVLEILQDRSQEQLRESLGMAMAQLPKERGLPVMREFVRTGSIDFQMLMMVQQWMQRRPQLAKPLAEALSERQFDPEAIVAKQESEYGDGSSDWMQERMKSFMAMLEAHREPIDPQAFFREIVEGESDPNARGPKWQRIVADADLEELAAWWKVAVQSTDDLLGRARLLQLAMPGGPESEMETRFREAVARDADFWAEIDADERLIPKENITPTIADLGRWIRWTLFLEEPWQFQMESYVLGGERWAEWMKAELPKRLAGEEASPYTPEKLPDPAPLEAKLRELDPSAIGGWLASLSPGEAAALETVVEGNRELRAKLAPVLDRVGRILPAVGPEWEEKLEPFRGRAVDRALVEELAAAVFTVAESPLKVSLVRPTLLQPIELAVHENQQERSQGSLILFTPDHRNGDQWHPLYVPFEMEGTEAVFESDETVDTIFAKLAEFTGPDATKAGFIHLRLAPSPKTDP